MTSSAPEPQPPQEGRVDPLAVPKRIVLFDGTCGLCERTVQTLLRRDHERLFHYAPLQGTTAARLRERYPDRIPAGLESVVYVDTTGPSAEIATRSRAAMRIVEALGDSPASLALLRLTPEWIADLFYRLIAACRYKIFGRIEQCAIPDPEDRPLFLD